MSPLQNLEPRPSETCSSSESTDGDGDFGDAGDVSESDGQEGDVHDTGDVPENDRQESDSHDDSSTTHPPRTMRRVVRDLLFVFFARAVCVSRNCRTLSILGVMCWKWTSLF